MNWNTAIRPMSDDERYRARVREQANKEVRVSEDSPPVSDRTRKIWELYATGVRPKEIARRMGLPPHVVHTATHIGRQRGVLIKQRGSVFSPGYQMRKTNLHYGRMEAIFQSLTVGQSLWLIDQVHRLGMDTILEYVVELVRDAYEEDKEKNDG